MNWSKLPKKDKQHLRENNILYKRQFEEQIQHMKKVMDKVDDRTFVCWDCLKIAKKLGMWSD